MTLKDRNAYLIGDSAGLATIDLGEGIGPAVESGLLCAREIMGIGKYNLNDLTLHSVYGGKYLGRLFSPLFHNSGRALLGALGVGKA